jgi:hypothetical protein
VDDERGGEDGVGDEPPAGAAAALLLAMNGDRDDAGERNDDRESDEQGRRMQRGHREIIGSGLGRHDAISPVAVAFGRESVT